MPSGIKISPTEYRAKFQLIHPDLDLITDFINFKTKVKVKDCLGIIYNGRPQCLLLGKKPSIQIAECFKSAFEIKSISVHGDIYNYSLVEYKNAKTPVDVVCAKHGVFKTTYDTHIIRGHGCQRCGQINSQETRQKDTYGGWSISTWNIAASNSKEFDGFKLYILKCFNNTESFIKIGRTFKKVKDRFEDKNKMPYKWEILFIRKGISKSIFNLERKINSELKNHKYVPKNYFDGFTECFEINIQTMNYIKNIDRVFNEYDEPENQEPV